MSTENHNYSPFLLWKDLVREVGLLTVGGILTVIMGNNIASFSITSLYTSLLSYGCLKNQNFIKI